MNQLLNLVINKYLYIRLYHEVRKKNDDIHKSNVRAKYTKLILFQNQ